ncbi:hypothetical protein [Jejuia pallidilutea]|jgi:hypothetical protein|uniref:Uncharacterized protein n=1 Tax=Jejuia pallidilutea TaxID=504487 RepID=A0A090W8L8_9FLAO|nr:hypothetical protein [Jejuia pallidilutea]PQV50442.1 hypothetical protein CLV33_102304 [Jejuia pallidilutea]GAL65807.1 hypothetical protein JCM19301_3492 [Jejuia pallidilutea]GAL72493.1 hypothetical protein JCM19302_1615 [Jejuia pallidilutea]GAL88542.1 hypothetical protein JCM19538_3055 [Jejuia pallidilutea]
MDSVSEFKNFYREKGIEELQCESNHWKSNLAFLEKELTFLKIVLDANIFNDSISNLSEILELFKKELVELNDNRVNLLDCVSFHIEHLERKKHYNKPNCNQFYVEIHKKLDYDVLVLFEESNMIKQRLFEFIEGTLI